LQGLPARAELPRRSALQCAASRSTGELAKIVTSSESFLD
jgi:hypothetical protein